jgi:3'-phosphoadenosine 5'-phosphosulfate sulfotransferase (PAPS reductase)/FAD synthetase
MEKWQLQQMQGLPLDIKIAKTKLRIQEWYEHWEGQVYVSFSGGKDSTVLLHLVREMYPDVPAVFVDTGLEYPEIREFVKSIDNVEWLKPKKTFKQVIDTYGYPVISKEISVTIEYGRQGSKWATKRLDGEHDYGNHKKYKYLLDAPFKISDKCCKVMKKEPIYRYEKENKNKSFIGTMADESVIRQTTYLIHGCNSFDTKRPHSTPIGFWKESDVLQYIYENNIKIPSIYGDVLKTNTGYITTELKRTGCMFCMFGVHLEKEPNRFQRMAETHPKLYDYCINKLGCGEVMDYIGVDYKPSRQMKLAEQDKVIERVGK